MKKRLKRIEAKLDLLLKNNGLTEEMEQVNRTIGGGGVKPPKKGYGD